MATIRYEDLVKPLDRTSIIAGGIRALSDAGFPAISYGAFDEPYATLQFEADALVDVSKMVVAIGAMGITADATGDALTVHAKEVYDVDRLLAGSAAGSYTLTDTSGSPQSFAPGQLIFVSRSRPDLTFSNSAAVTIVGFGSASVPVVAEKAGAAYNLQASDIAFATPPPGVTLAIAPGLAWITTTGTDDESVDALRLRCTTKWATLTAAGPFDAYRNWALASSAEINRASVLDMPLAVQPDPQVIVYLATLSGSVTATGLAAATAYIQARRPLGTRVLVTGATPTAITVQGTYNVKAAFASSAQSFIDAQLAAYFGGITVVLGGKTIAGLQIGDPVTVAAIIEILMSAPGVADCMLTDGLGSPLPTGSQIGSAAPNAVATLVSLLTPVLI